MPPLTVLGIETSCDDTACGIVDSTGTILGESKLSHMDLVKQWGGVNPSYMAHAHDLAVEEQVWNALRRWNNSGDSGNDSNEEVEIARRIREEIDVVAVTCGPGLSPCLRAGTSYAKRFAAQFGKPLLPVHHLEAHLLTFRLIDQQVSQSLTPFPFLVLLVSGGHCMLVLAREYRNYEILGQTIDDSVGEAFDKVARMLGLNLENGGGVELEKHARHFRETHLPGRLAQGQEVISFPLSMKLHKSLDFSFSGLKTAVLRKTRELEWKSQNGGLTSDNTAHISGREVDRLIQGRNGKHPTFLPDEVSSELAYAFQEAALYQLIHKTAATIRELKSSEDETLRELKTLVVAGGVAANELLRSKLEEVCDTEGYDVKFPPIRLCTDNGTMIAWAGIEHIKHRGGMDKTKELIHDPEYLDIRKGYVDSKTNKTFTLYCSHVFFE